MRSPAHESFFRYCLHSSRTLAAGHGVNRKLLSLPEKQINSKKLHFFENLTDIIIRVIIRQNEVENMKIENGSLLENAVQNDLPFAKAKVTTSFSDVVKVKTDALDRSVRVGQTGYDKDELTGKSAIEEFEDRMTAQKGAAETKDQMAVLANTLTPEDYKKMQEEGFPCQSSDVDTIVTVTDKIKTQLAKAGVDVSCMGDSLTKEQLEAIGGSIMAANQLQRCFEDADLPASEENMTEGLEAYNQAGELQSLSEGAVKYMLDNHLTPSIENLYMAEFSGSEGYVVPEDTEIDFEALQEQMSQVITAAGAEVNEQTLADSRWMIQSEIAFTVDNFSYMQKLCGLQLPMEGEDIAKAIATAVVEGDRPKDAMLLTEYSITAQAEHAVEVLAEASDEDIAYLVSGNMELTVENIEQTTSLRKQGALDLTEARAIVESGSVMQTEGESSLSESDGTANGNSTVSSTVSRDQTLAFLTAKRVLEETRLAMTTEANRAMLKQGISIDTKPLEELVEKLKEQEANYYQTLIGQSDDVENTASMASLFEETTQKVTDLKQMPAYLLGMKGHDLDTVRGLHEAGTVLKDTFEKAGESYEALMTAPRRDLGDSIQKAFANVEDILTDLGMENSEANQRAVRILAYNSLSINEESIQTMKAADERVQRTFSNLTPATVRELIRQGSNPLDMNLDELNRMAENIREENQDTSTERFSEYLWKLDKNHEISPEERESFIGIYRLIHQIEQIDGAAIGALISQGADLTMRNLLTAVRSAKKSGMDYTVDDDFAGVDGVEGDTKSITDQIETAYQTNCIKDVLETLTPAVMKKLLESPDWENYTPEQLKQAAEEYREEFAEQEKTLDYEYADRQLSELKQAAVAEESVYRLLERFEIPNTVDNILAANRLVSKRNQVFSQLFNSEEVFSGEAVDFEAIQQEILERFANALKTPKEMAAAQEALAETAENVMKTMIADDEHITSMDIRELKLMNTQLSIAGKMAEDETYNIPVLVGNEVTNLSLKIVRGVKKKGLVEIMFETAKAGKVAASISAKEDMISGLVATDNQTMKDLMSANAERFTEAFGEENSQLQFTYAMHLDFSQFSGESTNAEEISENEDYQVQTTRLYKIAKSFIETVKELEF